MPLGLPLNWDIIRFEYSQGATLEDLSTRHGVAKGTLFARSAREKWSLLRPSPPKGVTLQDMQVSAMATSKSLSEKGQAYSSRVFDKISKLVESANLPSPKNWKDLEIADKVARRAAGLDIPENQTTTVLGLSINNTVNGVVDENPVIDVGSIPGCEDTEEG